MITRRYSLCGIDFDIECQHPEQDAGINDIWQALFSLSKCAPDTPSTITLRFNSSTNGYPATVVGEPVFESDALCVLKTPKGFHLKCGESALAVDVSKSSAEGLLSDNFWSYPLQAQREFFLLSLLMLMRRFGLYGLHANAVVNDGRGCVIVGNSGAGKTTLTIGLIKQGWDYLSDDALMLRRRDDSIEALAFRRGFSLTPETSERFPELSASEAIYGELRDGKSAVNVDCVFPGRHVLQCSPRLVIFPKISGRDRSELVPLDSADALTRLLGQSPGIMVDKQIVSKQLEALTLLIDQTDSYELLAGTDIYNEPEAVSELLLGAQQG